MIIDVFVASFFNLIYGAICSCKC